MSIKNKSLKKLIEQDKKEQRELYGGNKSSSGSSVNKDLPENQQEIQERLNALRGDALNSGDRNSEGNSAVNNAFSNVLSKSNFVKGMAAGAVGSGLANNIVANNNADMKDYVQYQVKNADITVNDEILDLKDVDFKIRKIMNKHDVLELNFNFFTKDADKYKGYVYTLVNTIGIGLNRAKESGEDDFKAVFDGIIEEIEVIQSKGELSSGRILAYSKSILLDKVPKFRTFTNPELTVDGVINEIAAEYTDIVFHIDDSLVGKPIPHILFQFGETDFEFLNRMLNIMNSGLTTHLGSVVCGLLELTVYDLPVETEIYTTIRRDKNLSYKIKGTNPFNVVEKVNMIMEDEEAVRVVYSSDMWIENKTIQCEMVLVDLNDKQLRHDFPLIINEKMSGSAVEAKVVEVGGENGIATVTLDFTDGLARLTDRKSQAYKDNYAGIFKFPYTTMYSSTNSGMFVTPEANDVVSVYFPNGNDSLAYVQGCVNNPGNERASNPNVRNYTLGGDDNAGGAPLFNFQLSSNSFNVSTTDHVGLSSKNMMNISTSEQLVVNSKNRTVTTKGTSFETADKISSVSGSKTSIMSQSSVSVVSTGNVTVGGQGTTSVGGGGFTHVTGAKAKIN